MTQKHTQEPWTLSDAKNAAGVILGGPSRYLHTGTTVQSQIASACLQEWMTSGERDANARRIVACVNACQGLPTDELEQKGLITAVGTQLLDADELITLARAHASTWKDRATKEASRAKDLEQQRDELLAALQVAEGFVSEVSEKTGFGQVHTLKVIQAAITKITGETK